MDPDPRPARVVAIGASAGGVEALREIAAGLPADFPAPVLVVLHVPAGETSHLPQILARAGSLAAVHPADGDPLEPGKDLRRAARPPPDGGGWSRPRRPRADGEPQPACGRSRPPERRRRVRPERDRRRPVPGARADGAAGASAIARRGGDVVVQDLDEAVYPDMPQSAIAAEHPDYVLPLGQIPATIPRLAAEAREEARMDDAGGLDQENRYAALEQDAIEREEGIGTRAPFGCPECGGVLWEVDEGDLLRFRCRVGHAYAAATLVDAQGHTLDTALRVALRARSRSGSRSRSACATVSARRETSAAQRGTIRRSRSRSAVQTSSGLYSQATVRRPDGAAGNAVAFVASAGGVAALGRVVAAFPRDLAAALIVVLHLLPEHGSHLAAILGRQTTLRVREAADGDVLEVGCVYVAPPDANLFVEPDGTLSLRLGPPIHNPRPSGDVLLESLAAAYGSGWLAVILTGLGSDGTAGARAVKGAGGTALATDEATSEYFGMSSAAIAAGVVDRVLPLDGIAPAVVDFVAFR